MTLARELEWKKKSRLFSYRPPKSAKLAKQAPVTTLELWRWLPLTLTTIDSFLDRDRTASAEPLNSTDNHKDSLALTKTDQYTAKAQLGFYNVSNFSESIDPVDIVLCAYKHVRAETIDLEATKRRLEIPQARIDFYRRDWRASERFVVARILKQQIIQEAVDVWHKTKPELVGKLVSRIVFDLDLHREHYCLEYEAVSDALYTITKKDDLYEDYLKEPFLNLVRSYGEGNEQSVEFAFYYLPQKADEEFIEIIKEADKLGEEHDHSLAVHYAVRKLQETHPERFPEERYVEYRRRQELLKQEEWYKTEERLNKAYSEG